MMREYAIVALGAIVILTTVFALSCAWLAVFGYGVVSLASTVCCYVVVSEVVARLVHLAVRRWR